MNNLEARNNDANVLVTKAEIDIQVSAANQYPRNIKNCLSEAEELVSMDEETAQQCIYALPVGKDVIQGPSVRLAEIMVSAWGNLRVSCRITEISDKHVVVTGACWDVQKGTIWEAPVRRTIQNKRGGPPNDFMINNTVNAASSIAVRNAIFRTIPKSYVNRVYEIAKKAAIGDVKSIAIRRQKAFDYFGKMGITRDKILTYYALSDVDQITTDHLTQMIGAINALKEGTVSVEQLFSLEIKGEKSNSAQLDNLNAKVFNKQIANAEEVEEGQYE